MLASQRVSIVRFFLPRTAKSSAVVHVQFIHLAVLGPLGLSNFRFGAGT